MVDIATALRFPTNREKAWQILLVGGVVSVFLPGGLFLSSAMVVSSLGLGNNVAGLLIFAALTVSYVPFIGYLVRVLRVSGDREAIAPAFTPVGSLIADGLRGFGVSAAYMAIPYGVLGVIGLRILRSPRPPFEVVQDPPRALAGLSWAFFLLVVLALYLLPAALTNFARLGSVRQAFALPQVLDGAFSLPYFTAFAVAFVVFGLGSAISQALLFVLVGAFTFFWVTVVAVYLTGRGFCEARGLGGMEASAGRGAS